MAKASLIESQKLEAQRATAESVARVEEKVDLILKLLKAEGKAAPKKAEAPAEGEKTP